MSFDVVCAETGPFPYFTHTHTYRHTKFAKYIFCHTRQHSALSQPANERMLDFVHTKNSQLIYGNILKIRCHDSEEESSRRFTHILCKSMNETIKYQSVFYGYDLMQIRYCFATLFLCVNIKFRFARQFTVYTHLIGSLQPHIDTTSSMKCRFE